MKTIDCSNMSVKTPDSVKKSEPSIAVGGDVDLNSPAGRQVPVRKKRLIESEESDKSSPAGKSFRSQADWINFLDENFEKVICGGNFE